MLGGLEIGIAGAAESRSTAARQAIEGSARAIDADTLVIGDQRIRLIGIDAPEREQVCGLNEGVWPCGHAARDAVSALVDAGRVRCEIYGQDRWQRALAVCFVDRIELNAEIVRAGWARAWYPPRGAVMGPSYAAEQREASLKLAGIWQGAFEDPWDWRRRN